VLAYLLERAIRSMWIVAALVLARVIRRKAPLDGQGRVSPEDDKHLREYDDLLRASPSLTFEGREFDLGAHIPFEVVPRACLLSLATDVPGESATERYRVHVSQCSHCARILNKLLEEDGE